MRKENNSIFIKLFLFGAVVSIIIFYFFPFTDLRVSNLFFDDKTGSFLFNDQLTLEIISKVIKLIFFSAFILPVFIIVFRFFNFFKKLHFFSYRQSLYIITTFIFVFSSIYFLIKPTWQRARPIELVEFNGSKKYTPPFEITKQNSNSFVSGHTASAFVLICYVFLFYRRKVVYSLLFFYGFFVALSRIAQGAHFLSDTIFAALFTVLIAKILNYLFFRYS